MDIAYFTPSSVDACSFYRGIGPFAHLKRHHHNFDYSLMAEANWATVAGHHATFFQRPYNANHLTVASIAQKQMPFWADYDDDLLNVPTANPAYPVFRNAQPNVTQIAQCADLLTVTTPHLAQIMAEARGSEEGIEIVPNAFNDFWFNPYQTMLPRDQVVYWRGSDSHVKDLLLAAPALKSVIPDFPDWKFMFQGMQPWPLSGVPVLWKPSVDIMDYFPALVNEIRPSIMIVPLEDNTFNRSKSNIAWIEATMAGAAVLAPDWEEWQQPGIIRYSSMAEFENLLRDMIQCPEELPAMRQKSHDYIMQNLLLTEINKTRLHLLEELVNGH